MNAKTDNIPTGFERLNALLSWWGTPDRMDLESFETQNRHFRVLATDLSQAFNEASSCQVKALIAANEQLARSLQSLLCSRQPQELMVAQVSVMADLLESLADQIKAWADLTRKVHGCYATMVREVAEELAGQNGGDATAVSAKRDVADRPAGKESVRRAVQG